MTAKDVKEITYMPLVTFFSVLERPGKNRKGGCNNPLVRRGLTHSPSSLDAKRKLAVLTSGKQSTLTPGGHLESSLYIMHGHKSE